MLYLWGRAATYAAVGRRQGRHRRRGIGTHGIAVRSRRQRQLPFGDDEAFYLNDVEYFHGRRLVVEAYVAYTILGHVTDFP